MNSAEDRMGRAVLIWVVSVLIVYLLAAAAYITHIVVCIKASAWVLLAFGCIVFPVGVVHGWGVWLGVF